MTEFDVLDDAYEEEDDMVAESRWFYRALKVLREYLAEIGRHEFTAAEFRRWAEYHCDFEDPHKARPWRRVFNAASHRNMIRSVRPCSKFGNALWVAI
jgi:hypothetical protein